MHVTLSADEQRAVGIKARAAVLQALTDLGAPASRADVMRRARAVGCFTPRELAAVRPARADGSAEPFVDYRLSWALSNLRRDGLAANPSRGIWRLAGAAADAPEPPVSSPSPARLQALRHMPYRAYLRTEEWRRTRAAAIVRAGNACQMDVAHDGPFDVHHRTYERLGEERPTDLVVLCRACHALHHREYGRPRRERQSAVKPAAAAALERRSLLGRLLGA